MCRQVSLSFELKSSRAARGKDPSLPQHWLPATFQALSVTLLSWDSGMLEVKRRILPSEKPGFGQVGEADEP